MLTIKQEIKDFYKHVMSILIFLCLASSIVPLILTYNRGDKPWNTSAFSVISSILFLIYSTFFILMQKNSLKMIMRAKYHEIETLPNVIFLVNTSTFILAVIVNFFGIRSEENILFLINQIPLLFCNLCVFIISFISIIIKFEHHGRKSIHDYNFSKKNTLLVGAITGFMITVTIIVVAVNWNDSTNNWLIYISDFIMLISTTSYCLIKIDEVFKDDPNKIDIGHNILFIVLSLIKSTGYIFLCFHMNQVSEWNNAIPIIISRYVAIGLSVYLLLIYKKHIVKSREWH